MRTAKDVLRPWWRAIPPGLKYEHPKGDVVCCDALQLLFSLRENSADVVFLDPPFNLGKNYGSNGARGDSLREAEYLRFLRQVLDQSISVLKPGGALFVYHLPAWAIRLASVLDTQLTFRHWIAISMKANFARGNRLYPAHYALLYFTKGEPAIFHRPKIDPPRCRYCNRYVKDYGGYTRFIVNGVNLSDVWDDLSPVRHKKHKHWPANELSREIPARVVAISGRKGGVFVDPFAGSGTSLLVALEAGMRFIGGDREMDSWRVIKQRLHIRSR